MASWECLPRPGALKRTMYQTTDPLCGYKDATMATSLVASLSRDDMYVKSNGMQDPPLLNPKYITDRTDFRLAVVTFKR